MAQLLKMLPLFNEIEKILDNVNPDDLLEPEVKNTKKARRESQNQKENDYSDLEIKETIHHSIKRQIMFRMWFFDERVKANDFV